MSDNEVLGRNELFSDSEKPYASYIKTILAKVGVNVWDRFTNTPGYAILEGDPKRKDVGCIVDVWNAKEDAFFRRNNARHFERGVLITYARPENVQVVVPMEQYNDEQLRAIVNNKFFAFQKHLNETSSVPVLYRMLGLSEEMDKSEKWTSAIKARISEIQMAEAQPTKSVEE